MEKCPGRVSLPTPSHQKETGQSVKGSSGREPCVTCNGNPIHGLITSLTQSGTLNVPPECPSVPPEGAEGERPSTNGWSCKLQSVTHPHSTQSTLPISLTGYLGSLKKNRNLCGNFSVSGDTMEGIVQCLVFLKAFSVCHFNCLHKLLHVH